MTADDTTFLRLAIDLARRAREAGADPFGAVLVRDGHVLHQAGDRSFALSDPTYHAELAVISEYCRQAGTMSLAGCTLYASTEPCPMCAGAIHWARLARVVFSVSQVMLQQFSGGHPKPPCGPIINMGIARAEVVGPCLADEGLAVFEGYVLLPKAERPRPPAAGRVSDL
jgi:tRNA(Arg) A34 adenosine deaminase TadA